MAHPRTASGISLRRSDPGPTNGRHLTRDEWIAGRRYLADESLRLATTHDAPSIPFQEQENPNAYPSPCNTRLSERG